MRIEWCIVARREKMYHINKDKNTLQKGKTMRKIISLLLAVALMVSIFTVGIEATDTNPVIIRAVAINDTQFKITTSEEVTVLKDLCFALFIEKDGKVLNLTEGAGRYGGKINPLNTPTTEFTWTIDAGGNATSVISAALAAGQKVYLGLNGTSASGATGIVNTDRAVDNYGNGFKGNLTLSSGPNALYGVEVNAVDPNEIVSVKAISDYKLEISFVKPLASFAGSVMFGVLNTAGTDIYNSDPNSDLDTHAVMKYEVQEGGKLICWLDSNKAGMSEDGKNITKFIAAAKEVYPDHPAGIVLLERNENDIKDTGYLEEVVAEDGTSLKGSIKRSKRDAVAAAIGEVYESARLESASRINDFSLKIQFNKEVTVDNSSGGGFGIVALDENGEVLYDTNHSDMRYGGTVDKETGTEFIWTIGSSVNRSVTEILADWQSKGYTVKFCSNSGSGSQNPIYHNSRVVDANGNPLLAPVAKLHRENAVMYYALCDITNSTVTTAEIKSAIAIDDFRFEIKFDKPVKVVSKGCASLMAFDKDGNMLFAQDENQGRVGGTLTETTGTDINDTWTWTIDRDKGTATDVIGVWEMQGYTVKMSVMGDSGKSQGAFVDNRVTDGTYSCLKSNDYNSRTKQNCHTIEVSALDNSEDILIDEVVYRGSSQILVTFSEPVEINKPSFIGLRIVDKNGNYIAPIEDTPGSQHNMEWSYVKGSNQTQIILTFHSRHMQSMLNLTGLYEDYAGNGNHTVFMIGEKTANIKNGYIDDVVGLDGTGVLKATYAHLVHQELNMQEVVKDSREPLTVVSATAISDTDIVIKFSAPVEIDFSPFICLRVVNPNNAQVFGESGTRLQYYGTWKFADDKKDTIIWTSNNWNVKGLLSLTGPWAKFNKDGNVTRLCIEELDDKKENTIDAIGNGFIDNVVDARGMMLLANSIAGDMNTYDGLYVDVVEDYQEPAFYLKSVEQTGDKKLTLTFNKPVYFDEKPYMAIRFVNDANVLQYDDGQPLQYQGSWEYGNEEKTVLIWTATYGGSVNAIVNRTGKFANYPDYNIMFCIEEIPADKKVGDLEDGTIHNMYTDGNIRLYANVVGAGGNRDGVYMPITGNYVAKDESTSVNKTDNPILNITKPKEENKVIPTAGGPASAHVLMAAHAEFKSMLPWVALGVASVVFIGVMAVLVSVFPKKKDE